MLDIVAVHKEYDLWLTLNRLLISGGAVTQTDSESRAETRETPGQRLYAAIREWGDALVALRIADLREREWAYALGPPKKPSGDTVAVELPIHLARAITKWIAADTADIADVDPKASWEAIDDAVTDAIRAYDGPDGDDGRAFTDASGKPHYEP
jgi:hypothetical protein